MDMEACFAHLWQQDDFADIDVFLTTPAEPAEPQTRLVARFPGHNVLLSKSPFFAAQVIPDVAWTMPDDWDDVMAASQTQCLYVYAQLSPTGCALRQRKRPIMAHGSSDENHYPWHG